MTDKKKIEELNEAELDQITGGASIGDIKPGLTDKSGKRVGDVGIRKVNLPKSFASSGSANPTV